jgi:heme-degrading monooxygenase HmoA
MDPRTGRWRRRHVVVTAWPSHEVFGAWIATPECDALTASEAHQAVSYRPIVGYDLAGGYTNLAGWAALADQHPTPNREERQ